jgi:hypothetical protein
LLLKKDTLQLLPEINFSGEFPDGFLPLQYLAPEKVSIVQISGEPLFTEYGCRPVPALKQRAPAENIKIIGVRMILVIKFNTRVKDRKITPDCSHFMLVYFDAGFESPDLLLEIHIEPSQDQETGEAHCRGNEKSRMNGFHSEIG